MHKWIAAAACAAAVSSFSVVSAQTYPQAPDQQPTAKSAPATRSGQTDTNRRGTTGTSTSTNRSAANSSQRVTVSGCFTQGNSGTQTASAGRTNANAGGWILSNATMSNGTSNQSSINNSSPSRSGSPSNEGTSANNRNGTEGAVVSGSTSTAVGTSGTNATVGGNIDTEAHGAGTLGATDQAGSTVGAGATVGVTADDPQSGTYGNNNNNDQKRGTYGSTQTTGTSGSASAGAANSYQLSGITNPNEYANKRVEITGMMMNTRANASSNRNSRASSGNNTMPMLRVTSVRVLGDNCQ
jgi:hypothetical protein